MAKNDFLESIIAKARKRHLERKAAGDPTVDVYFFESPWSIESLGPPNVEPALLEGVEAGALASGTLRNFWDGHELLWQTDRKALVSRFLSSLEDQAGHTWDDLWPAARASWSQVHAFLDENPEINPEDAENLSRMELSHLPSRFKPDLGQTFRLANRMVEEAVETTWSRAFAEGRILVFERVDGRWEFRPPRLWRQSPPFYGLTLNEMLSAARQEFYQRRAKELKEAKKRIEKDDYNIENLNQKFEDRDKALIYLMNVAAREANRLTIDHKKEQQSSQHFYRFLVSADLPASLHKPGGAGDVRLY